MRKHSLSMLPPGMEGKYSTNTIGRDNALQEWQRNATQTISRSMERSGEQYGSSRARPSGNTIRTVTPDDSAAEDEDIPDAQLPPGIEYYDIPSSHTSPRSIPGGEKPRERRQGLVFDDSYGGNDSSSHQKLGSAQLHVKPPPQSNTRPRTRTLDEPRRRRQQTPPVSMSRHRIGSVHAAGSAGFLENTRPGAELPAHVGFQAMEAAQASQLLNASSIKEKPGKTRRLRKKSSQSSPRPSSPDISPTVGSLSVPVETADANKILKLMKSLLGRMRGAVEYQVTKQGPWISGVCYIDDLKGVLVFEDEDRGPFYEVLIPDLRGCRVKPTISPEKQAKCLEISTSSGSKLQILPFVSTEFDHWLAALLCWQQIGPGTSQISLSLPDTNDSKTEATSQSPTSSTHPTKEGTIIKVGKLLLWDKGALLSPASVARRLASKDARPARRAWKRVSCILQDNGEFKLLTENDVTLLSVIQLSQLSRTAIQRLDRSVLNEEYCIAIFPQYTSVSTSISIVRPVYIALESRVLFEVWFVLLRAFTIPELYGSQTIRGPTEHPDTPKPPEAHIRFSDMFRIEKSLSVRVIEAKMRKSTGKNESPAQSKNSTKSGPDPAVGDYFAEVILDGEVRSKTMTKTDTKTPFWREDAEFNDLPATLPALSVVLKRVSTPSEAPALTVRSSTSIHSPEQVVETIWGTVDLRLDRIEKGKDNESWWPILDDNQESIGEMYLKVRHDETAVLMAKDYQPLSELLHRFSSGLTINIAQVVSSRLRALSETLMNIFQVSGQSTAWLMALVEDEIDGIGKETSVSRFRFSRRVGSNDSFDSVSDREQSVRDMGKSLTGEANLLFRGNTLLTQALDFHMRRVGKEYLEDVLLDKICEINVLNPDCEVDPSRLAHGDDITKNWATLIALTTSVWESIASSAKRCPAELRQILKFIRAVADDRYGDFLRTVPYTSVTGFLFLRFFCPAILNPKLFGLLRDHPRPKAQRTLTLIAKSLQVLANLSTFGQKEEWMEPMNRFLSSHRQGVKDFINDICSISAERGNFTVPASYSTPITILGRLSSTSREGFPSLPYLIDHARNFAILVKLWLESTQDTFQSRALEGDLVEFHKQCISLQQRTDECIRQAEHFGDNSRVQWDEIVSGLSQANLDSLSHQNSNADSITNTDPDSSSRYAQFAPILSTTNANGQTSITAPGSSGSATSSKADRREPQTFWEQTFGSNFRRPYDPEKELERQSSPPPLEPPSRDSSRNGKGSKSFFTGLRKKSIAATGKERDRDRDRDRDKDGEGEDEKRPGSS